jgi:hypothetical protein
MASIAFCTQHWELLVQPGSFKYFQMLQAISDRLWKPNMLHIASLSPASFAQ